MSQLAVVILAAGQSTRMKSKKSKVLHLLAGSPVVHYPIAAAKALGAKTVLVVRGPNQDDLKNYLKGVGVRDVVQKKPLGTADAVQAAAANLKSFKGNILILCGDVPLIRSGSLLAFVAAVGVKKAKMGVLTMSPEDPTGYGRIVRDLDGNLIRIVEEKDATDEEKKIREVNSGIIIADKTWLFDTLKKIGSENAKGEFYLTDLIGLAVKEDVSVCAYNANPFEDFLGINTRIDLAWASEIMRARINKKLMLNGVGILDLCNTHIDNEVRIGQDTTVMPYSFLLGKTRVGSDCVIENGVVLRDAVIGNCVHVKAHSVIEESVVSDGAIVGPFSRMRPQSKLGKGARIGNFVELKKCELKEGAKANHLTYLGDAVVGKNSNVGCGTITCNYDGKFKHKTLIGDRVFVGSDVHFVAPVSIGRDAFVGAGSTITKDVPAGSLALARSPQIIVKGWVKKRKGRGR